jgi:DNA-binding HxlR family transcriptional regulator
MAPGRPVRGSRTGRPIMVALDLMGRRWTLRVLWELREGGLGFRELQARCDAMSASVLSRRLGELREAGIVETGADGVNRLTADGAALLEALGPLDRWAKRWSARA